MKRTLLIVSAAAFFAAGVFFTFPLTGLRTAGSDHGDTPSLTEVPRHDARITDLYAFRDGDDLVLALCVDPTVAPGVSDYAFQPDAVFEINIDNSSAVSYDDQDANLAYGGTIVTPGKINSDIAFRITFPKGEPRLRVQGIKHGIRHTEFFAGLRDDPFIRGPREGRNVAAIVIKVPFSKVLGKSPELLIWAYSRVPDVGGRQADLGARALRSQFPENDRLNELHPRHHNRFLRVAPDVVIYNTDEAASFPNGRALEDDVVDLVGDMRVLGNDDPFPTTNDVPFLSEFPYLAPPQ